MQCNSCGSTNPDHANFCNACGARLLAVGSDALDGERRHLTVLFSDLVGSTEIAAQLDPEHWHEIMLNYQRAAGEAVAQFGGRVEDYLGDGLVAYFGYPAAAEDAAERAVRAGLAIVSATRAVSEQFAEPRGAALAVRVGLHAGSVVMAPGGSARVGMFGEAPNIASRVQDAAAPNTVAMTAAVYEAVSGLFVVEDMGPRRLKGMAQLAPLYRAVSAGVARRRTHVRRGPGRFVGRFEEMRALTDRCRRAREGEAQFVLIAGEPGIGKSRMVEELRSTMGAEPHLWIECAGEPLFSNSAFHAVTQAFGQALGWRGGESQRERAASLEAALKRADLNATDMLPMIPVLLNLPPPHGSEAPQLAADGGREQLIETLTNWVLNTAKEQFVVIALEDLHWVDPSTLELLKELVEGAAARRLLIVATARPEFRAPWTMRPHHAHVALNRLASDQVRELATSVLGEDDVNADLIDRVVERAEGVPLFAEELARLLSESGGKAGPGDVPATLQDSLAARLDRLGVAKETAQLGAVLGREFSYDLIRAISTLPMAGLQDQLAKLCDADLLYAKGRAPEASYRFKHVLVQDAAYGALLKRRRRALHQQVAETIVETFAAMAEAHPELLAHHWTEAGAFEAAVDAWSQAGKSAGARHAHREAADAFERGLAALAGVSVSPDRDARELQIWRWLVGASQIAYGYSAEKTRHATRTARALAERTGDVRKQFAYVAGDWMAASSAGDYAAARKLADQLLPLAQAQATPDGLATAHMILLTSRCRSGDLVGAEAAFRSGEVYFDSAEYGRRPGAIAQAYGNAAISAWILGDIAEARRRIEPVLNLARGSDNPYELAFAGYMAAMVSLMLDDFAEAEALAQRSIECSEQGRFPQFAATSSIILGQARAQLGAPEAGRSLILDGLKAMERTRSRAGQTMYYTWLAMTHRDCGALDEAQRTVSRALTMNPQEKFFRPESLRLRGELRLSAGEDEVAATEDFRKAASTAKRMKARLFRERALANLAAIAGVQPA